MAASEQHIEGAAEPRRPYAAPANVKAVLQRTRTRNLPSKIDDEFLQLAGISPVVFGRVKEALVFLGLISKTGSPTDRLEAMGASSDEEYRSLLATAVREAYSEDFQRVDPALDGQPQIVNAFRRYQPRSQTSRMVMLYLGLCREAGIPVQDAPRERQMRRSAGTASPKKEPPGPRPSKVRADQQATPTGLLFGFTETDASVLSAEEFDEVWAVLGKVARARARSKVKPGGETEGDEGVSE